MEAVGLRSARRELQARRVQEPWRQAFCQARAYLARVFYGPASGWSPPSGGAERRSLLTEELEAFSDREYRSRPRHSTQISTGFRREQDVVNIGPSAQAPGELVPGVEPQSDGHSFVWTKIVHG